MGSVTQKVWSILENEPTIKINLHRKIINHRALAKYLIDKSSLNNSMDSVISAIRRFEVSEKFNDYFHTIAEVLEGSNVSTKINLVSLTFTNNNENFQKLANLLNKTEVRDDEKLKILSSNKHIKIIIDKKKFGDFSKVLPESILKKIDDNLGEIQVSSSEKAHKTKGVIAKISSELASYNININEMIACLPDLLIYIKENDLPKAHDIMIKLCRKIN